MIDLFEYTDYRAYLRDALEARKKKDSFFSLRYFAQKSGTDAGTVVKILQGQLHLSARLVPGVVSVLKMDAKQAEYFQAAIDFSRARTGSEIRRTFERLGSLKGLRSLTLEESQYTFYQRWYHSAVRAAIGMLPFAGDWKELADCLVPPITVAQARESVALLERIGLVAKGEDGTWTVTEAVITTGEKWKGAAVREFQRQTLELAMESLERDAVELREHSTVTLTLRRQDLPLLKQRAGEFRQDLLRMAADATCEDAVFQVNVQMFPLALKGDRP